MSSKIKFDNGIEKEREVAAEKTKRGILDRARDLISCHCAHLMWRQSTLKKEFKEQKQQMKQRFQKQLQEKEDARRRLEDVISNGEHILKMQQEMDYLQWQLETQPGIPNPRILRMDPEKQCVTCKRQIVLQEYVEGSIHGIDPPDRDILQKT